MKRRIWLLTVAAFIPYGVCLYDMGQNPIQATPAILSLMTGCVLLLAASLLLIFPEGGQETVTALVATACLFMTARAVVMQSVPVTAVTVVVAGFLYLLFTRAQPRIKVKEQ